MKSESASAVQLTPEDQRQLERIYADLAYACELDLGNIDPSLESIDDLIPPGKFRLFIQQDGITAQNLKILTLRFLTKDPRDETDWDKLFLLLAQFVCIADPKILYGNLPIGYFEVAQLLAPILGKVKVEPPESVTAELEPIHACKRLADAEGIKVLDRSRRVKKFALERNDAESLVLVTHFNLSVRKTFLRLLHLELAAIYDLLGTLENRGKLAFDASLAGLSSAEPITRVREICLKWTSPARVSFGSGDQFAEIIAIRLALEHEIASISLDPAQLAEESARHDEHDPVHGWLRETIAKLGKSRFHADVDTAEVCFTAEEVRLLTSNQMQDSDPLRRAIALRLLLTLVLEGKTPPGRGFTLQESYAIAVKEATALAAYLEQREVAGSGFKYTALTDELFSLMVDAREKMGFFEAEAAK